MGLCTLNLYTALTGQLHASTTLLQGSSPSSTHGIGNSIGLKAVNGGIGEKISPAMNWTSGIHSVILLLN
jgi:hypothetical protein